MEQFDALLRVAEKLLSPEGCPWDRKQTLQSLQPYVLEEAHEVIEAVDQNNDQKMVEELGDLLYTIIFYGKLGERLGRFSLEDIFSAITEKLIRRHPHIFADVKVENIDDIVSNWEKIKKEEKQSEVKVDDLPPTLPVVVRAQKLLRKMHRSGYFPYQEKTLGKNASEEEIGEKFLSLIAEANENDIDAESALRRASLRLIERFEKWESS